MDNETSVAATLRRSSNRGFIIHMSDLDNAIKSINESAVKAENTASFLDDMSTFDDQSSVTNPNNGQTVASIPKQVKDRTDELFTAAESEINQAVATTTQNASEAEQSANEAAQSAGEAATTVETQIRDRVGIYKVGNISDYAGQQLTENEKENQYQYPDNSEYWYGVKDGEVFPITIPSDPSSDEKWSLASAVTKTYVNESQNEIIGGSIFRGSNGEFVQNGDTIEQGITHLAILNGVKSDIVAYYPQLSGQVSNLTSASIDITYDNGGVQTTETCAIYSPATTDKTIELNIKSGENAKDILTALSIAGVRNSTIRFPQNTKIYLDPISTRFQECIFEIGSCHIVPTTEDEFMWTNYGQRNTWVGGKIEPEGYDQSSRYEVMLWSNDATTPNASRNKWVRPFMTGVHKGIIGYSDDNLGGSCYRHEVLMPDITGTIKSNAGGLGIYWRAPNGATLGNSSGNDSKVIGGVVRKFESNLGASRAFAPKFIGVGSDGAVNAYQNVYCSQMQIVSQYTEFCDKGLNLESGPIGTQMIGGTVASSVPIKISGSQASNLPVYVAVVQGVPMRLDLSVGYQDDGKLLLNGQNGVRLGLFDGVDNNLVSSVDLVQDGAGGLKLSMENMSESTLSIEVPTGKRFKFKSGSGAEVLITDNGEIELSDNRYIKAGLLMQVETTAKSLSYKGSYILNDSGTYYLAVHDGLARYRTQLNSF